MHMDSNPHGFAVRLKSRTATSFDRRHMEAHTTVGLWKKVIKKVIMQSCVSPAPSRSLLRTLPFLLVTCVPSPARSLRATHVRT